MRKHLVTAVSARQVELPRRPCEDRMEIPSDCQHAQQQPSARPGSAPPMENPHNATRSGSMPSSWRANATAARQSDCCRPRENQPRGCPSLSPQWR
jgi:hypothetical protein